MRNGWHLYRDLWSHAVKAKSCFTLIKKETAPPLVRSLEKRIVPTFLISVAYLYMFPWIRIIYTRNASTGTSPTSTFQLATLHFIESEAIFFTNACLLRSTFCSELCRSLHPIPRSHAQSSAMEAHTENVQSTSHIQQAYCTQEVTNEFLQSRKSPRRYTGPALPPRRT